MWIYEPARGAPLMALEFALRTHIDRGSAPIGGPEPFVINAPGRSSGAISDINQSLQNSVLERLNE
jgi:hypothetical protein